MKIKNKNINLNEAMTISNYENILLKRRNNNLLLSDYQINVLKSNGIDYNQYSSMHDLLFRINFILQYDYQEELDMVASQISEVLYYTETKK